MKPALNFITLQKENMSLISNDIIKINILSDANSPTRSSYVR